MWARAGFGAISGWRIYARVHSSGTGSRLRKALTGGRSQVPGVGTAPRRRSQLGPAGAERQQQSDGAWGFSVGEGRGAPAAVTAIAGDSE